MESTAKPLLILGTGDFAIEVADLVSEIPGFRVTGFVQSVDPGNARTTLDGLPVLWIADAKELAQTHWAVCALGTTTRRNFIEQVAGYGMRFATLIHPTSRVSPTSSLGEGTIVSAGAVISARSRLGRHVIVNRGALVGHHCEIGDYVTLGPGVNVAGSVSIGESTFVGIGAIISDHVKVGSRSFLSAGVLAATDVGDHMRVLATISRAVDRGPAE